MSFEYLRNVALAFLVCGFAAAPARADGPCILLRNGNVLFGQARQIGEFVHVQRGEGGEVRLPRGDVACWAGSVRDLYQYRIDHRPSEGTSVLIEDARWCVRYDLTDLAERELARVRLRDPSNPEAISIAKQIASARAAAELKARAAQEPSKRQWVDAADASPEEPSDQALQMAVDIDPDALRYFASHIQPTLINRCGQCHWHMTDRPFALLVPGAGGRPSARMTRDNLVRVMAHVDRDDLERSPLLEMAVTPHGGAGAAMDIRHTKSLENLKQWLFAVAGGPSSGPLVANPSDLESGLGSVGGSAGGSSPAARVAGFPPAADSSGAADSAQTPAPVQSPVPASGPARLPAVEDPFSPDLFNRRHHPQRR